MNSPEERRPTTDGRQQQRDTSESVKMQNRLKDLGMLKREMREVRRAQRQLLCMLGIVLALTVITAMFTSDNSRHIHERLPHSTATVDTSTNNSSSDSGCARVYPLPVCAETGDCVWDYQSCTYKPAEVK